jgi:hypothetical protein
MKLRVLAAAGAVLLLTGCGSVHPGAAAVVDDTTISMSRADDVASVYCKLSLLSAQEGQPIPNADVRRQAVTDLVVAVVADEMAEDADLTPNPSSYEVSPAQRDEIAQSFPEDELDEIVDTINDSQRTFAIAELLGEREVSDPDAETQQLQEEGFQLIQAELERRDVEFDPRYGLGDDLQQNASTGSLSVPVEALEPTDPKELPATQQCAA